MTALSDLVAPLKRELAAPGQFDTIFPESDNGTLVGTLADGFCEAQLDGWFGGITINLTTNAVSPDLSIPGRALSVFYASARIIQAQLRNQNSLQRYKAGPVEYETQQPASVLRAELDRIASRKAELKTLAGRTGGTTTVIFDAYFARASAVWAQQAALYSGAVAFFGYELWRC